MNREDLEHRGNFNFINLHDPVSHWPLKLLESEMLEKIKIKIHHSILKWKTYTIVFRINRNSFVFFRTAATAIRTLVCNYNASVSAFSELHLVIDGGITVLLEALLQSAYMYSRLPFTTRLRREANSFTVWYKKTRGEIANESSKSIYQDLHDWNQQNWAAQVPRMRVEIWQTVKRNWDW